MELENIGLCSLCFVIYVQAQCQFFFGTSVRQAKLSEPLAELSFLSMKIGVIPSTMHGAGYGWDCGRWFAECKSIRLGTRIEDVDSSSSFKNKVITELKAHKRFESINLVLWLSLFGANAIRTAKIVLRKSLLVSILRPI